MGIRNRLAALERRAGPRTGGLFRCPQKVTLTVRMHGEPPAPRKREEDPAQPPCPRCGLPVPCEPDNVFVIPPPGPLAQPDSRDTSRSA